MVALARGRVEAAAMHHRVGLDHGWDGGYSAGVALNLHGPVRVGNRLGEPASVARLIGAVDAFGRTIRALPPSVVAGYEADVARVRETLGAEAFAAARAAGRALPPEQVVAEARTIAEAVAGPAGT